MRNLVVAVGTLALSVMVIGNAYLQKKQFYPSVVYITKSNPSMAVSRKFFTFCIRTSGNLKFARFPGHVSTSSGDNHAAGKTDEEDFLRRIKGCRNRGIN